MHHIPISCYCPSLLPFTETNIERIVCLLFLSPWKLFNQTSMKLMPPPKLIFSWLLMTSRCLNISFHFTVSRVLLLFSCSVVSNSLWPYGLQHVRLHYPKSSPGACSNSCPLSWWCHPTIKSSVVPFSCFQSFPAWGSFQMSRLFASDGQNIGASVSASVFSMNI